MGVTAESTRWLPGNLFELQDLGIQTLKGIAGPVRACSAVRWRFHKARSLADVPARS